MPIFTRKSAAVFAVGVLIELAACAPKNVRPFEPVAAIDSYCTNGKPIAPTVTTIMSSVSDTLENATALSRQAVISGVKQSGGAVAHWNDLNLYLPNTAKVLGDDAGYVHIRAAAIGNPPADAQSRMIDILVHQGNTDKWYAVKAFDIQDICVVGTRQA